MGLNFIEPFQGSLPLSLVPRALPTAKIFRAFSARFCVQPYDGLRPSLRYSALSALATTGNFIMDFAHRCDIARLQRGSFLLTLELCLLTGNWHGIKFYRALSGLPYTYRSYRGLCPRLRYFVLSALAFASNLMMGFARR